MPGARLVAVAALQCQASRQLQLFEKYEVYSVFTPLPQLLDQLNQFQPTILSSFANTLILLAKEQLAGRLKIQPLIVFSSGETLFPEALKEIESAWGVTVWNYYGLSETGHIGQEFDTICPDEACLMIHSYQAGAIV